MAEQEWTALPEPVRARMAELAAAAVGELPPVDVPAGLRRLARFTPSKRARLGSRQLVAELRCSAAFRASVLAWWQRTHPDELTGPDADPVTSAAGAVLADAPDAAGLVAEVAERADLAAMRVERDNALARVDKLTAELERLRAELTEARSALRDVGAARDDELDRLRRRFREQGSRLREAEDGRGAAERELAALRDTADERLASAHAERDRAHERAVAERTRAARATDEATGARDAAREARRADRVRLALLMDTLAGAVDGLRGELAMGPDGIVAGPRPAELVTGASAPSRAGRRVPDEATLDRVLRLPSVHLVVDGYNVTKTAYPELPLFDQRARLLGSLGVLAARTAAEVTVVFDGASVVAGPTRQPRGVRVLFSDPGVPADDVIVELVSAEPPGRPVVVASSDRAVTDATRARGAHSLASAILVGRLARG
ncbi:MAG TPA: NYN domain-containing protein [Pseudonocardia sp.]|jgi:predicted RNA-binding protein with PIN domain